MNKFKTLSLIPTMSLLLVTTLNIANADSNPIPFLPPIQHSQTQSHTPEHLQSQQQHQQQPMSQAIQKHTTKMANGHNNQFDNQSPSVTSVMPF
jgi:hypothetical protein